MKPKLPAHRLERLIFEFRGEKVMIDADLAALYGTETKKLKQQVKRNRDRFPKDFMFELTTEQKDQVIASSQRLENLKHASVKPLAFTEQGVAMLSSAHHQEGRSDEHRDHACLRAVQGLANGEC